MDNWFNGWVYTSDFLRLYVYTQMFWHYSSADTHFFFHSYLVVISMYDREGCFFSQMFGERAIVEEGLGALPSADLTNAGNVKPSPVSIFLGWLPA